MVGLKKKFNSSQKTKNVSNSERIAFTKVYNAVPSKNNKLLVYLEIGVFRSLGVPIYVCNVFLPFLAITTSLCMEFIF